MDGQNIAQYRVLEKLGAGGMGQIYKALDTRLNRTVAIKVLPASSSADPERRKRFLIEAQAASALNHPNIITIHDVISHGDGECMVMELIEGKTLNDLVPRGGLRVPQALNYMLQMADALVAAHNAGIVHRDLKPANIMVTHTGLVKVLDFGLAKLMEAPTAYLDGGETSDGGSRTRGLTMEGSILGTLNYMSPEQAEGKRVDSRSDIFSFGAVLYEMLTGVPPFQGESSLSTLSAILRDDVKPLVQVAPDVPALLDTVVRRCLAKNPDDRWQSMNELRTQLLSLKRESDSGTLYRARMDSESSSRITTPPLPTPAPRRRNWVVQGGVAAAILIAIGVLWVMTRPGANTAVPTAAQPPATPPPAVVPAVPALPQEEVLNNAGILKLLEGKVPADLILSHIRSAPSTSFDLSTDELIRLTKAGATAVVIDQMRNPKKVPAAAPPAVAGVRDGDRPSAASTPATELTLTDGLPFKIALTATVPTQANVGMPLRFAVVEDVLVQGVVVLAKGSQVSGEITQTPKRGFLGIGDEKMSFSLSSAPATSGATVKVRAVPTRQGNNVPQRPIQVSGKNVSKDVAADPGTEYVAYVDGAQNLPVRKK